MTVPSPHTHVQGDVVTIQIGERLDADCGLLPVVTEFVDQGFLKFLVNLGPVARVDSGGLASLVWSHLRVSQKNGRLALLHVPERLAVVLEITKLRPIFHAYDSETSALASFETGTGAGGRASPSP
jgi:anti-anti-sigma factor